MCGGGRGLNLSSFDCYSFLLVSNVDTSWIYFAWEIMCNAGKNIEGYIVKNVKSD